MPAISVIIPVYQVEAYLRDCVDSVLAQTFSDFEIILVDDGSPDSCGSICDEYAQQDPRIRVIHQENGGLSAARNAGTRICRGAYVTFLDSDDMLHPQALEIMLAALKQANAQICVVDLFRDPDAVFRRRFLPEDCAPERIDSYEALARLCGTKNQTLPLPQEEWLLYCVATAKLFERGIAADNPFPPGKYHEDEFTAHRFFYAAKTIAVLPLPLYYYRFQPSSITAARNLKVTKDGIFGRLDRIAFLKKHGMERLAAKVSVSWSAAEYAIYCKAAGVKNDLPKSCRISAPKALYRMRRNTSQQRFLSYFESAYPRCARLYKRFQALKRRS